MAETPTMLGPRAGSTTWPVSQVAGPDSRSEAWLAVVHRNTALGGAPAGQPSLEGNVSLRPGPQPRWDRLRTPVRLVPKDSGQVPRGHHQKWAERRRVGRVRA